MLVPARLAFAMRCPQCGKWETSVVSLFDFSGGATVRLTCSCGSHKVTGGMRRGGPFWVQVPCYLCDGMHFTYYAVSEFWAPAVKRILCIDTDLQLGAFGGEAEVAAMVPPGDHEAEKLLEDTIMEDYFENPEIMYQALTHVHDLADAGHLNCQCGNRKVEVDIFSDRLELSCPECGGRLAVHAADAADLERLEAYEALQVGEGDHTARENPERSKSKARSNRSLRRKK